MFNTQVYFTVFVDLLHFSLKKVWFPKKCAMIALHWHYWNQYYSFIVLYLSLHTPAMFSVFFLFFSLSLHYVYNTILIGLISRNGFPIGTISQYSWFVGCSILSSNIFCAKMPFHNWCGAPHRKRNFNHMPFMRNFKPFHIFSNVLTANQFIETLDSVNKCMLKNHICVEFVQIVTKQYSH